MIKRPLCIFFIVFAILSFQHLGIDSEAHAGNLGFGVHSGYGVLKYEEETDAFGQDIASESMQDVLLFGVSGEYTFTRFENFYTGITTDWALGLEDTETWTTDGVQFQTNDMRVYGQFYDLRLGYKDSRDNFSYRLYLSGGWDGMHFKRSNFIVRGAANSSGAIREDFSLWRTGVGIGLGYKIDKWTLDTRAAYSYYPKGSVDNSSYPDITFDTNGTCLDMGVGISRVITEKINFYAGFSYTLLSLDQSDIMRSGSIEVVFPNSRTEIMAGMVNLTYAF